MQSWIELDFKGLDGQIRKLERIKSKLETDIDRIMLRAVLILEAEVKRLITDLELIDTGALRASVHSFVRNRFGLVEGVVQTPMEYAQFPEFGTGRRGAANPHPDKPAWYQYGDSPGIRAYKFMHTAWENKKETIISYVNTEFGRVIFA